jgi:hypothetical protein
MVKKTRGSAPKQKPVSDKGDKKFKEALANLEKIAQERILLAGDPFSVAVRMAKEIRKLSDRIEKEAETGDSTEAGGLVDYGGEVGIGVM